MADAAGFVPERLFEALVDGAHGVVVAEAPLAEHRGAVAGGPRGGADGLDAEACEFDGAAGEAVEVGRENLPVAVDADVAVALAVGEDDDEVGLGVRGRGRGAGG